MCFPADLVILCHWFSAFARVSGPARERETKPHQCQSSFLCLTLTFEGCLNRFHVWRMFPQLSLVDRFHVWTTFASLRENMSIWFRRAETNLSFTLKVLILLIIRIDGHTFIFFRRGLQSHLHTANQSCKSPKWMCSCELYLIRKEIMADDYL